MFVNKKQCNQVCCSGILHRKLPNHHCCESSYQSFTNSSDPVCCHGTLVPALPEHRCCGGYYVRVQKSKTQHTHAKTTNSRRTFTHRTPTVLAAADETCCPDPTRWRVSVGLGDSCCAAVPYSTRGGQLCCSGSLHDGYGAQCCGGHIVDDRLVCCGGSEEGEVHSHAPGEPCRHFFSFFLPLLYQRYIPYRHAALYHRRIFSCGGQWGGPRLTHGVGTRSRFPLLLSCRVPKHPDTTAQMGPPARVCMCAYVCVIRHLCHGR